jgi:hypothetical protein
MNVEQEAQLSPKNIVTTWACKAMGSAVGLAPFAQSPPRETADAAHAADAKSISYKGE